MVCVRLIVLVRGCGCPRCRLCGDGEVALVKAMVLTLFCPSIIDHGEDHLEAVAENLIVEVVWVSALSLQQGLDNQCFCRRGG